MNGPANPEDYKSLIQFQGKVVTWAGYDSEEDRYILLFNNNLALSVTSDGFSVIQNPARILTETLSEQEMHAEQILALKKRLIEQAYLRGYECGQAGMVAESGEFPSEELLHIYQKGLEAGKTAKKKEEERDAEAARPSGPAEPSPVSEGASGQGADSIPS